MTVRLADVSDDLLPQAAQIWFDGWHDAHAAIVPDDLVRLRTYPDFVRRLKDHVADTRLAVREDQVLGFVIVLKDELYQMYVAQSAQGSGVARTLMDDALARIGASHAQTAWLSCSIGNARAASFYEKTGWTNTGEETVGVDTSAGKFDLNVWRFERAL